MSRRYLAVLPLALLLLSACQRPVPPNVLLIVIDTLRADHLGAYGHPARHTPHIDALAERSVVFERAVAASSRTAPSHASMMTSRFVREHGIGPANGTTALGAEPTLAGSFAASGYETAAFVSNYVLRRRTGLDRGFALYDDELTQTEANRPHILERTADQVGERAVAWLEEPRDRPFFLWVHFQDPHGPYEPPPSWVDRFAEPPEPGEAPLEQLTNDVGRGGLPAYQAIPGVRFPSEYRSRYVAEIAFVDDWVGRVLEAAERASGEQDLVVLLTADHGESLGEHGIFFAHGTHTLPGVSHVPMLLHAPGLAPARRDEIVHHVDVLPTLLDLARLPVPDAVRGHRLGRLIRGGSELPDRVVFSDIGLELGAYHGERYVRILRKADSRPLWSSFRWTAKGIGGPLPKDPELRRRILPYLQTQPHTNPSPLSSEERERLRALGYLDPAEERPE